MTEYSEISARVLRLLDDPTGAQHGVDVVYDGFIAAQKAILPWVPKMARSVLTIGADGYTLTLPADLYAIQSVQEVDTGEFIPRSTMIPKTAQPQGSTLTEWMNYPIGYIRVFPEKDEGEEFVLYYIAYWNAPEDSTDTYFELECPSVCHQALIYYTAAHCLTPRAVGAAGIRQYNLKVDSGTPEDNPLKDAIEYLRNLFFQEMKLMPPYMKAPQ